VCQDEIGSNVESEDQASLIEPSTPILVKHDAIRSPDLNQVYVSTKYEMPPSIPHCPHANAETHVQNFIDFHQAFVMASHYLWFSDYNQFCKRGLLELAGTSASLQYAVSAYSALLHSVYVNPSTKELAFLYYAHALYCVQNIIHCLPNANTVAVLATILQLASFEVRFSFSQSLM